MSTEYTSSKLDIWSARIEKVGAVVGVAASSLALAKAVRHARTERPADDAKAVERIIFGCGTALTLISGVQQVATGVHSLRPPIAAAEGASVRESTTTDVGESPAIEA